VQVLSDGQVAPFVAAGRRSVVTIGAYDGVHRGHRSVIALVRERASALDAESVVVTFDRHPAAVVRPESAPLLLTELEQRLELLETTGVDAVCVVAFDEKQSREAADDFVARVLVDNLAARLVVVGEDFHFGHRRAGNVALLREAGTRHNFSVEPLSLLVRPDGVDEPVSSTAIRRELAGGHVDRAATLLGRAHQVRGVVVAGDRRGREIGFPTANVEIDREICLPADGVYAGRLRDVSGAWRGCAINLGRRPTFDEHADRSLLEAHVLDFSGDLYGQRVAVEFHHFLRSERRFSGIDELREQLQADVAAARALVSA